MNATAAQVRYFVVVAEHLHFGRAAAVLRISPPSLSQQIARLEASLGRRLLDRSPRGVSLTDAGRELLPLAIEADRAHRAVEAWGRAAEPAALRVGVVAAGAGELTTRILGEFVARRPGQSVQLVRLGFFEPVTALREGSVDVVIAPEVGPPPDGLESEELLIEGRVLVVREDHPLAARETVRIDETNDCGFVVVGEARGRVRDWWLVDPRPDGSRPRVVTVADDAEGLMELCVAGIGVNIAAASVATHFGRPGLAYVPISDIEPVTVLLSHRAGEADPLVASFRRVALEIRDGLAASPPVG